MLGSPYAVTSLYGHASAPSLHSSAGAHQSLLLASWAAYSMLAHRGRGVTPYCCWQASSEAFTSKGASQNMSCSAPGQFSVICFRPAIISVSNALGRELGRLDTAQHWANCWWAALQSRLGSAGGSLPSVENGMKFSAQNTKGVRLCNEVDQENCMRAASGSSQSLQSSACAWAARHGPAETHGAWRPLDKLTSVPVQYWYLHRPESVRAASL